MNKKTDDLRNALETIRETHFPEVNPELIKLIIDTESDPNESEIVKARRIIQLIEEYSDIMDGNNA